MLHTQNEWNMCINCNSIKIKNKKIQCTYLYFAILFYILWATPEKQNKTEKEPLQ